MFSQRLNEAKTPADALNSLALHVNECQGLPEESVIEPLASISNE